MQTKIQKMKTLKRLSYYLTMYLMLLSLGFVAINTPVFAQTGQNITIKGTVVDNAGIAIPGATILVKGTNNGTISDIDGNFSLDCKTNDIISISFIGYLTIENTVQANQTINAILIEDIAKLDEVVVVGYGTMRKSDLTGSISSLSAEDLNKGVITTTEQVLQGKVAGLTVIKGSGDPTEGATMRLRGGTSLIASSTPLVVIDGIPGVDINSVQASDIESIDVLKDASAAAIYGSRGANGVILITTTKAGKGKHVEYSNFFSVGKQAKYLDLLTANAWREKVEETNNTKAVDFEGDTDWQKEITQTSFTQSHNIAFSNSAENGGYRASLSYLDNEGIILTSNLKRLGASISAYTYGFNDKLKIDMGIHSTFDEYTPVDGVYGNAYMINPTAPVYDSTGAFFQTGDNEAINPVEILKNATHDNSKKRILGYAKAELEIFSDLKGVVNSSYEFNTTQERLYYPTYSKYGASDKGYGRRALNEYSNLQLETYLNYDKELAGGHRINIMGGYSYLDNTYEGFSSQRREFDTDLFLYNNLQSGIDVRSDDVGSYKGNSKLISFFGRANYSFNGKYILTGTIRRDGSSKFGKNNKWGIFPSAAIAWKISDEAFMNFASNWLSYAKIRAGYGVTGSQEALAPYQSLQLLGTEGGKYYDPESQSWKTSYMPIQNANPDLKWETTAQSNFGIDVSIANRISATLDLYKKITSDLLFTYAVPQPPNLYNETTANVGDLSNKGIELSLNYDIIKNSDFQWNVNLSLAKNTMKIDKLSGDLYETDAVPSGSLHGIRGMSNEYSQTIREGYAVGTFWGQECTGIDIDGNYLNVNGDILKSLSGDSLKTNLGNAQPKLSLGLSTGGSYKNFDFSISTYGLFGQKVLNATAMSLNDASRFPQYNVQPKMFEDSITAGATFSSYWIEDASFFRIQSLTLGYTFKFKDIGISKLRLYASGENLMVITKYSGLDPEIKIEEYDPEQGRVNSLKSPGIDWFNVYPRPRTFTIGLSCTF